ncbi:hypothetical protein EIP86_001981 [Pleurotus ostreatoroseus]|nr:hypothetical protein EIP86_001981 [Pleurotus ostreatoroseus]
MDLASREKLGNKRFATPGWQPHPWSAIAERPTGSNESSLYQKGQLIGSFSTTYFVCLPILLARPYGSDFYSKTLRSFHDFLSSSAPTSFLSLRDLKFSGRTERADFDIMADILKHATNLRSLTVGTRGVLRLREDVVEAISSLSGLKSLLIRHEDPNATYFTLRRLEAPLTHLHLEVDDYNTPPLPSLSNFQDTLEDLFLQRVTLTDVPFSFCKLTRLHLNFCPEPLLSVLVNAFPNLEVLVLKSVYKSVPDGLRDREELRADNIEFQVHKQWHSLKSLTVDELGIRAMSLQTEVDSVVLPCMISFSDKLDHDWLYTLMRFLRPRHLQLTCDDTTRLQRALSVGMERLDRLDLLVDNPGTLSPEKIMDGIYTACRFLQARMIFCDINIILDRERIDLAAFEPENIARTIMLAAPKVTHIKLIIELYDFQPSHTSYWAVNEDGDEKQLRGISSSEEISCINRMFLPAPIQKDNYELKFWPA